ncbi:MAG TPA: glycosyltransferase [Candidatus Paceibacterota bacterium]
MERKKILFVITKSNFGGAQRYCFDLATHLPKSEFEVKVVYGGTGEADAKRGALSINLQEKGIDGIFLQSFMRDVSFLKDARAFFELLTVFRRECPDIVHLNSSKAGGIGALAARFARVPKIIFTVHGWPFLEDRSPLAKALIWIASLCTVLLCHKVICISEYDLRIAKQMPFIGERAVRIYNGIAPMSFGSGENIRNAFPPGVTITGTIGELTRNKKQIALIEEARHKPSMYVAIVGSGEEYVMLDYKIKKYSLDARVKLFGFLPANEVLKGFDVFALPSLKEGLPYVLLEATAAGLPIIANRVGGIPEILYAKDLSDFSLQKMIEKTVSLYR